MASVTHWLNQLESKTPRERLLLLLAMLALLLFLVYQFWLGPQLAERERWLEKEQKATQETQQIQLQIKNLETVLQQDPDKQNREKLSLIKVKSTELDARLLQQQATMIAPELMPKVLHEMLHDLPLALVSLQKLPPEIELDSGIKGVPMIYRHGLRLKLEGSYSDTLNYLERLEQLGWRLAWEALDIQMKVYPKASIILNLYTLSFDEDWLGV